MAHETVRHMRKECESNVVGPIHASMTGGARIARLEFLELYARRISEVRLGLNGLCDCRPDVIQLCVQGVIKLRDSQLARSFDLFRILVAAGAKRATRKKIVFRFNTLCGPGMANRASKLLLKVNSVGKGCCRGQAHGQRQQPN